jgi:formylglycine-generating enzyme required for sulfatase activity
MKQACASDALCDATGGTCIAPKCSPMDDTCVGNTLKTCKADFTGFDMVTCKAPNPSCDSTTKKCIDRGPTMVPVGSPVSFYVDSTEVTNAQYNAFLATGQPVGVPVATCNWNATYGLPVMGADAKPVINVDWCDAANYCAWAGKRLCGQIGGGAVAFADTGDDTKSQWTNACDGGPANKQLYPYASKYSAGTCNDSGMSPAGDTVTVGLLGQCQGFPAGLFDMSGNAAEWEDGCSGSTGATDICPTRGGSYKSAQVDLTCAAKGTITRSTQSPSVGFRCCADP